jgi:hypothetical protein
MATQTKTQRQAAGHKAAATRKRGAAKRSAATTRTSARQTTRAATTGARNTAAQTSRGARRTGRQAGHAATQRLDAAGQRVEELGRRAQRALYIQVGAAADVRDRVVRAARTFTDLDKVTLEFDRLERRGARVVDRTGRTLNRRRRDVRTDAGALVERVKELVR